MNEQHPPRRRSNLLLRICCFFGILLVICYMFQPDWLAAVVLVPPWIWLAPAGLIVLLNIRQWRTQPFRLMVVLCVAFLLVYVEQSRTLFRSATWPTPEWQELCLEHDCLRVISLNCGDGGIESLREVAEWKPDLVLIQESPGEQDVRQVAEDLFGENAFVVYEMDTSIIGRGEVTDPSPADAEYFVHARVKVPAGTQIDVVSLRLSPPVAQTDFWTPGFWINHRDRRREHREEIKHLIDHLKQHAESSPVILGGDFNAPAYDAAVLQLYRYYEDTFHAAGRGWGATGTNEHPYFRVDQIWVNKKFQIGACFSQKTVHSDHRMVICDLLTEQPE